jgi:hypothetical protein
MIACGSASGFVHLMEVSENMSFSAKNDKAILNAVSKNGVAHSHLFLASFFYYYSQAFAISCRFIVPHLL